MEFRKLNEKKMKMMDFLQIQLDMILEGTKLYVVAKEEILGASKTLVGTLEKEPSSWSEFPVSLRVFDSAILVGDISQRDIRKNKNVYQLRMTSSEDEMILMWINVEDIQVVKQKKQDLDLVELANSVKIVDGEGASGEDRKEEQDDVDDVGDDAADSFRDTVETSDQ